MAAAMTILQDEGIDALTLRACARKAGVSHAAPRHHFESVAALQAEIAARGFENFVAWLDKAMIGKPDAGSRLAAMCEAYVAFALANPAVYALMFRQGSAQLASPHLKESAMTAWQQLEEGVRHVLPETRSNEAATQAAFVWSSVHGLATLLLDRRLPPLFQKRALISANSAAILRAIRA